MKIVKHTALFSGESSYPGDVHPPLVQVPNARKAAQSRAQRVRAGGEADSRAGARGREGIVSAWFVYLELNGFAQEVSAWFVVVVVVVILVFIVAFGQFATRYITINSSCAIPEARWAMS